MPKAYSLFLVKHPVGEFIGVAENIEVARAHWGTVAGIEPITEEQVIERRGNGKPDRVFLAV